MPFQLAVRAGLVAYGVVHLLVAWLAVQVAVGDLDGGGVGKADKTGALQSISANAGGDVLLWLVAVGLGVTSLWQLFEAVFAHRHSRHALPHHAMNLGEAILFGYLAFSAGKVAVGSPSSTDNAQLGFVGWLLNQSWGKPAVVVIGLAVVAVGLFVAHHGIAKRFAREHDLGGASAPMRKAVIRLGQVGYTALGAVYGLAGALVVVAAVHSRPEKATGLDVALKTLATQPHGTTLLLLIAAGLAIFAVFTLLGVRYRQVS